MSDQMNALIAQIVALANSDNVDKVGLVGAISFALGVSGHADGWNADGTSKPDERGFIKYKRIDEFCQQMAAAGHGDIIKTCGLDLWFASKGGSNQLTPGSDVWQGLQMDMSWAGNPLAVASAGRCFKFHRVPDLFAGSKLMPIPSGNASIPYLYYDDALAISHVFETVDEQLAELIRRAEQELAIKKLPKPPAVDFSPSRNP